MLDSNGFVAEGSGQNLFVVRDSIAVHGADLVRHPARHHARFRHEDRRRSRLRGEGDGDAARVPLHRGRGLLLRHGSGTHADPLDRPAAGRRPGKPGPITKTAAGAVHGHLPKGNGSRSDTAGSRPFPWRSLQRAAADARLPRAQLVVRTTDDGAAPTSAAPRDRRQGGNRRGRSRGARAIRAARVSAADRDSPREVHPRAAPLPPPGHEHLPLRARPVHLPVLRTPVGSAAPA